jgi:hypothetical protein
MASPQTWPRLTRPKLRPPLEGMEEHETVTNERQAASQPYPYEALIRRKARVRLHHTSETTMPRLFDFTQLGLRYL